MRHFGNTSTWDAFMGDFQSRINGLTADFTARDDPCQRNQISADRQKALTELQSFVGTTDAELRTLIEQAIPKVRAHLERAQQLQSKLGTGNP